MSRMALKKASNPGEVSGEEDKKERKETKTQEYHFLLPN